jgi:hypothetical protein
MKMVVFWVVVSCSLVAVYRRFRGTCLQILAINLGTIAQISCDELFRLSFNSTDTVISVS